MSISDKELKELLRKAKKFAGYKNIEPTKNELKQARREARVVEALVDGLRSNKEFMADMMKPLA